MDAPDQPATEAAVIARSAAPLTAHDIVAALRRSGVVRGESIIVHSSLSRLGWVVGAAQTVVESLLEAVGRNGTIVMPAHTGFSDPSTWQNPPVPESWWQTIRDQWPAFDPLTTPLRAMGAVVDCFRRLPDVAHSGHPRFGFVARGPNARSIVADHPLEEGLGDASPLGKLYDGDARIVLLGVGHDNNTALHLAEHRATYPGKQTRVEAAPMVVDGERRWVTHEDLDHDEADFPALAAAFAAAGGDERRVPLGTGVVTTCRMRAIVDFGAQWLSEHRR